MEDTPEVSPFAAFAMPKRSVMEELQERQRRAAHARRLLIGCVLAALVGSVVGATACTGYEAEWNPVLSAFVGAFLGGCAGVVLGMITGGMCFGAITMTGMRGMQNVGTQLARRDPLTALRGLMFAWALIGAALGAAAGSRTGAEWAGADLKQQSLAEWTVVGSLLGGGFGLGIWFLTLRKLERTRSEPPG